jgi:methyl-accepting chemotaxis protein
MSASASPSAETAISDLASRLHFIGIDTGTRAMLPDLWRILEPELEPILARFYAHVRTEPMLDRMIGARQNSLEKAQTRHWSRLFSGQFDADYAASIDRIGRIHQKIGLEQRWYVAGYQFVLSELTSILARKFRFSAKKACSHITALNKVVMFDLDLALSTYQAVLIEERAARNAALATALDSFDASVRSVLSVVDESAMRLQGTAENLTDLAKGAFDEADAANHASLETSGNVQSVATATEELNVSIQEIARLTSGATEVVRRANRLAETSSTEISRLSTSAQNIGDVVSVIRAIAEQTNLLALNATIEAARAGEAGKGFAVVASEVKALAAQTSKATDEIAHQITEIQSSMRSAVDAIGNITATMRDIDEVTTSTAAAIEEQNAATREIADNIHSAATGTQMLSANITRVSTTITDTRNSATDVLGASGSLSQQSNVLSGEVQKFLQGLRADLLGDHAIAA